jgi:hypothetical protein
MSLVKLRQRLSDLEAACDRVQHDRRAERDEQEALAQSHWLIHDPQAAALHGHFWSEVRAWQSAHGCGPCLDESEPVRLALAKFCERMKECFSTGATAPQSQEDES